MNHSRYRMHRRRFLQSSVGFGISFAGIPALSAFSRSPDTPGKQRPDYRLALDTATRLFDGNNCWAQARTGIIPGAGNHHAPLAVITMNLLDLSGSDVFKGMFGLHSEDFGKTWTTPQRVESLFPRHEIIEGITRPVALSDCWPEFHRASGKLLNIGHTVVYTPDWKVANPRPRHTGFSVYDAVNRSWSAWQKMEMPDLVRFYNAGAGCVQRYDEPDGTILLPFYFTPPGSNSKVAVARCTFDGQLLKFSEHGNEIKYEDNTRGLHEPSITRYRGMYYLTIRHDTQGFVTRSRDGLNYEPIRTWKFDDGSDLGNYNTQQHWVTHSNGLFLVYTRRGAGNDHIFRHRAPLFIAEVDPERLCVIRETERILVPQRGARLGNFGVTDVSPGETWVTVSEWMQPKGVEKYGSDGSVFVARIHWESPNHLFQKQ